MRLFHSLANHLSFTAVANELHLSQSGVSIQIKRLTESVGIPLIEKIGKKIYLTDAGRELYAATDDVLNRLELLNEDLQDMGQNIQALLVRAVLELIQPGYCGCGQFFYRFILSVNPV